jgi:hypothetical protein
MKRLLPYILISAFLFPAFGHASAAPITQPKVADVTTQTPSVQPISPDSTILDTDSLDGKPLSVQKTVLAGALTDILNRLSGLSSQTQLTINQINASGLTTDQAQTDIINANFSLAKAKTDIDKIASQPTLDDMNYGIKLAEDELHTGRVGILQSLIDLQASLPGLDSANQ